MNYGKLCEYTIIFGTTISRVLIKLPFPYPWTLVKFCQPRYVCDVISSGGSCWTGCYVIVIQVCLKSILVISHKFTILVSYFYVMETGNVININMGRTQWKFYLLFPSQKIGGDKKKYFRLVVI